MSTPHHTLEYLNSLRNRVGKSPLKSWKESKAKLDDAVVKLENQLALPDEDLGEYSSSEIAALIKADADMEADEPVTIEKATPHKGTPIPKPVKVIRPTSVKKPAVKLQDEINTLIEKTAAKAANTVTLVQIAAELGINPRVARAKMRRVKSLPEGTVVGKHTYSAAHKQNVIDALKHDFRKK